MKIPLSKPYITDEDIRAVVEVLQSGYLSLGPKLVEFEENFAKYAGVKHAIAVNSGTSGLHLIVKSLGLKEGDEVITTPFSFIASSNCILFEGAKVVFVDIDKDTYNIDPKKIEIAITPRTKAILPVHVFGEPCDMEAIMGIAQKHNLKVIEDSCEAIGATYKNKRVGTFGDASIFAFYPNKQMTTGEGGMIVTDNDDIASLCKSYRNQGRDTMAWLGHSRIGYNYRLDEMSCALGVEQLKKIDNILLLREKVANKYIERLSKSNDLRIVKSPKESKKSWFVFVVELAENLNRNNIIEYLKEKDIASNTYFPSIHLQDFYTKEFGFKTGDFPVSEEISRRTLALPFYSELTEEQIEYVCKNLLEVIEKSN